MAGGKWSVFARRIKRVGFWHWIALIVLLAILLPLVAGVLGEASLSTIRAVQEWKRHTG